MTEATQQQQQQYQLNLQVQQSREKEKKKRKKIQKNLQNKSKNKNNVFLESLLSESFPSLGITVYLTPLGCSLNTVLVSGPAVGAAQILICSYSSVFLPPMSAAIRTSVFSFVRVLNDLLHIPQTESLPR